MLNTLIDCINVLSVSNDGNASTEHTVKILESVLNKMDVEYFNFSLIPNDFNPNSSNCPAHINNMNVEFLSHFYERELFRKDPTLRLIKSNKIVAFNNFETVRSPHELHVIHRGTTSEIELQGMREITDSGNIQFFLARGFNNNNRFFSALNLTFGDKDAFTKHSTSGLKEIDAILAVCNLFILQRHDSYILNMATDLSAKEIECLKWLADGKNTEITSRLMNLSISGVKKHIKSCCLKLEAENRTHAVAKAMKLGLISP